MTKGKYPISREYLPFSLFTPSVSREFVLQAQKYMKVPGFLWKDKEIEVTGRKIEGYQGGAVELLIMTPKGLSSPAPCLINIHGGGFVFDAAPYHYRLAFTYAKEARCKVVFVRYRLAPEHAFPSPQEDSFAAVKWVAEHTDALGIDPNCIGIAGDSAGASLSVASILMARDRGLPLRFCFQMLFYPWLDGRNESESFKKYTDTPMWNATLSKEVMPLINPEPEKTPLAYRSPVEAESLSGMPPAYIEVAEFDCLHDDGVLYASLLREEGIPVKLYETEGTMHGYDIRRGATETKRMIAKRVAFLRHCLSITSPKADKK